MTARTQQPLACDPDRIIALATGSCDPGQEAELDEHVERCGECREVFEAAQQLRSLAATAGSPIGEQTQARLWQQLATDAGLAAARMQRRAAWRTLWSYRVVRWATVGCLALALLLVGLLLVPAKGELEDVATRDDRPEASRADRADRAPGHAASAGAAGSRPAAVTIATTARHGVAVEDRTAAVSRPAESTRPSSRPVTSVRRLACGATLAWSAGAIEVIRNQPRLAVVRLTSGKLSVRVPHLAPAGKLSVSTPDAVVTVKGTRFTVTREAGNATTVAVAQGTVWVQPAGRNRKTLVLYAGDSETIAGEKLYLEQLRQRMDRAIVEGSFQAAARHGQRYLQVTSTPGQATDVRLKLAGAYGQLGELERAERILREVADGSADHVSRENALALLAGLLEQRGRTADARRVWERLLSEFPLGVHTREARMRLVRATCRQPGERARGLRAELARCCSSDEAVAALLRACASTKAR